MFDTINNLIVDISKDPFNPVLSFNIAVEYEKIGQTASAVSFYLRTAEYGYKTHPEYVYASLLRSSGCFKNQTGRDNTVKNLIDKAVAYLPSRPEAWFVLAQYYERNQKWQECYTASEVGLSFADIKVGKLPIDVGYWGKYVLTFEKAVSAWWVGRKDESLSILRQLLKEPNIATNYLTAVKNNLNKLDDTVERIDPLEPVVSNYRKYFGAKAPFIIDIGTRDGDDAYYLHNNLNGDRVVAIDADRNAANATLRAYPWMTVLCTAVGDTDGSTTFNVVKAPNKEDQGMSSIFDKSKSVNPKPEWFEDKLETITVPITRMDTLLQNLGLSEKIDVIKLDTEGYSWQVLQGLGERLKDVKILHVETEKTAMNDEHRTSEHIVEFMEAQGFALVDTSYEWGWNVEDQVWVNKALVERNKEVWAVI